MSRATTCTCVQLGCCGCDSRAAGRDAWIEHDLVVLIPLGATLTSLKTCGNCRPTARESPLQFERLDSSDGHVNLSIGVSDSTSNCRGYKQNGILHMLDRNKRIKPSPHRFQDDLASQFDVIITVEERVYDQVIEEMHRREPQSYTPVHIINMDIEDNHEEATLGAFQIVDLCEKLEVLDDLEDDIVDLLQSFERKVRRHILHTVAFY